MTTSQCWTTIERGTDTRCTFCFHCTDHHAGGGALRHNRVHDDSLTRDRAPSGSLTFQCTAFISQIITPVVERSVTIACMTTRELVVKDFAMEPDEGTVRQVRLSHAALPRMNPAELGWQSARMPTHCPCEDVEQPVRWQSSSSQLYWPCNQEASSAPSLSR